MDATTSVKPTISRKRKQTPEDDDYDLMGYRSSGNIPSSEPASPGHYLSGDEFPYPSPAKKPKRSSPDLGPTTERVKQLGFEDDYYDDSFDADFGDDIVMEDIKPVKLEEINPVIPPSKPVKVEVKPKIELKPKMEEDATPAWLAAHAALSANVTDSLGTVTANGASVSASAKAQALEEDGSLRMFWLDYLEAEGGKVHFIGKVLDKATGRFVSCCATVEGIERNVYVLPRERTIGGFDNFNNLLKMLTIFSPRVFRWRRIRNRQRTE